MKNLRNIIRRIIKEETKEKFENFKLNEISIAHMMFNHALQETVIRGCLTENIDFDRREDVLRKIMNGEWEYPQNPKSFYRSMNKSKHIKMLTSYSPDELAKMQLFKVDGYNIGFALKTRDDGELEIVAVHNNEPEIKNIGTELVIAAIKNGGCYLDHFSGYLSKFYNELGFEEISRDKFDPQYDEDFSFRNEYGESDIIYRKHKNCK